jgi:hypothetical protein
MWILMLVGGGLMVVVIGPFSLGGFGGIDPIIFSGIKVGIALVLFQKKLLDQYHQNHLWKMVQ